MQTFKHPRDVGNAETCATPSIQWLAHEINSLLDGSTRSIRLARHALEQNDVEPAAIRRRLEAAEAALLEIAAVLSRTMDGEGPPARMLRSQRSLGEEIERVLEVLAPLAEQCAVETVLEIDPKAAAWPAGPLGSVLSNGIRNAIEACVSGDPALRRVDVSIAVREETDELMIVVTDTGCGVDGSSTKPGGHGLGLALSRDLVAGVGGHLTLTSGPCGRGAVLRVSIPRHGLIES